jgi:hypothetical protein
VKFDCLLHASTTTALAVKQYFNLFSGANIKELSRFSLVFFVSFILDIA